MEFRHKKGAWGLLIDKLRTGVAHILSVSIFVAAVILGTELGEWTQPRGPWLSQLLRGAADKARSRRTESTKFKLVQIPLIMDKIAKSLASDDLRLLRSTSRLWNTAMLPRLRVRHPPIGCGNRYAGRRDPLKMLGALATILGSTDTHDHDTSTEITEIPFGKLHIYIDTQYAKRWGGRSGHFFDQAPVRQLTSFWGNQLSTLDIEISSYSQDYYHFSGKISVAGLRHMLFNQIPQLRRLGLNWTDPQIDDDYDDNDRLRQGLAKEPYQELPRLRVLQLTVNPSSSNYMDQLVKDLLRAAKGLETLKLNLEEVSSASLQFMADNPYACKSLRSLKLGSRMEPNSATQLANLSRREFNPLRLSWFKGNIECYGASESDRQMMDQMNEFFRLQSPYLTHLRLRLGEYGYGDEDDELAHLLGLRLLQMTQLKTLKVHLQNSAKIKCENCPNLKSLVLQVEAWVQAEPLTQILTPSSRVLANVTQLVLKMDGVDSSEMFETLAVHFPALTRLTISVHVELVRHIWGAWPLLEHLDLTVLDQYRGLDADITGIPEEACVTLMEQLETETTSTSTPSPLPSPAFYELARSAKTAPGIQDLRNLRVFKLVSQMAAMHSPPAPSAASKYNRVTITDVAGYVAFARPPPPPPDFNGSDSDSYTRLQFLSIPDGACISEACGDAIKLRLGLPAALIKLYC